MTAPGPENSGSWTPPQSDPVRYRVLFDTAPVMYHSLDASGRIIECNSTECRTLGYKWSDLVGKHITEVLAPDDAARWPADFEDLLEHGSLRGLERRLRRRDGSFVDVLVDVAVEYGPGGRPAYTKAVFVDVTERKRLERELRESLRQLESVFHGIRDLVILHDTELRIVRINRGALERLGIAEEDAVGRPCHQVYHGLSEPCGGCPVRQVLIDGKPSHGEATSPAGVFDVHAYPIYNEAGVLRGVVEYARDVREERRLRAEALQSEKLRSLGQMAGGVANDFNGLLGAIKGYASLLLTDEADVEHRTALKGILAASNQAADLTRRLLSFARRGRDSRGPLRLNRVAEDVAALLQRTVDASVRIRVELDPSDPAATGDASALHNAALNLCLNARDAMPSGGELTISTSSGVLAARSPSAEAAPERTFVAISVSDTGTGIPPEIRERLFEPFFSTKGTLGTGLGLSTVYGIVQAHDGRVEFDTEVGRGSTFRLLLPPSEGPPADAVPAAQVASKRPSLAPEFLGRPPSVLVIDDEAVVRSSLVRILRRLGYDPRPAASAVDAVALVGSSGEPSVDAVLLDVTVPDVTPERALDRLREAGIAAPVILMGGDAFDDRIEPLLRKGAAAFLAKPFDMDVLGEELAEVIVRYGAPAGASGSGP